VGGIYVYSFVLYQKNMKLYSLWYESNNMAMEDSQQKIIPFFYAHLLGDFQATTQCLIVG
jgi:hypothetical protein